MVMMQLLFPHVLLLHLCFRIKFFRLFSLFFSESLFEIIGNRVNDLQKPTRNGVNTDMVSNLSDEML